MAVGLAAETLRRVAASLVDKGLSALLYKLAASPPLPEPCECSCQCPPATVVESQDFTLYWLGALCFLSLVSLLVGFLLGSLFANRRPASPVAPATTRPINPNSLRRAARHNLALAEEKAQQRDGKIA